MIKCSNIQSECSKCPLPAVTQAVSRLRHSLIALSITSWSRRSNSSSTRWHSSSTSVIRWWLYTHSCRTPTLRSRWGFRSDCSAAMPLIASVLRAVRGRPLSEQRSMLPIASILLSTVSLHSTSSFYSETFSVFLLLRRASVVLLLLSCAYLLLKKAFYAIFNKTRHYLQRIYNYNQIFFAENFIANDCRLIKKLWEEEGIVFKTRIYWIFGFRKLV